MNNNVIKGNTNKLASLEYVFIVLLMAIYLLPSVSIGSTVFLGVLLMYSAYIFFFDRKSSQTVVAVLLLVVLLALVYAFLTNANSIAQTVSNRTLKRFISKMYQYYTLYFPAVLFVHVKMKASSKQKKTLMVVSLIMIVFVMYTTWMFLLENPNATREWENFDENAQKGVANYYFIYAIPIIISIITACYVKLRKTAKYVSIVSIFVGLIFLINAQYTLSVLISIVGIVFQVYRSMKKSSSKVLFVLAVILISFFIPSILEFAIANIKSEQMTIRLSEIRDFLTGKGAGGYNLNGRFTLYWRTILAFFESPLIGNRNLSFDGHATFLTVLSDTGLVGGAPFYSLLCYVANRISGLLGEKKNQFASVVLMFVLMGVTNPIHASQPLGVATWFIAPLMIETIFNEEGDLQ
ncbi:MAG: hypothetical protein J6E38_07540 [Clostridia bacterium]|nr:hypothetical protein [Clostridia bacterium]MBO5019261.1 hypothetical protein [Clostridia bacterium]